MFLAYNERINNRANNLPSDEAKYTQAMFNVFMNGKGFHGNSKVKQKKVNLISVYDFSLSNKHTQSLKLESHVAKDDTTQMVLVEGSS